MQWHRIVQVTLDEGEERLAPIRLYGLRLEFEHSDQLFGSDEGYIARNEQTEADPAVELAIERYERILRAPLRDRQLDGLRVGQTMTEDEARRLMYEAIAAQGRRERERSKREGGDE